MRLVRGFALILLLGLPPAVTAQDMKCGDCHDQQARAFAANAHARGHVTAGVVSNDACETCHGSGAAHIEGGGDTTKISVPRGLQGANDTCVMCHDLATDRKSHRMGAHANSAAVNCLSCHSVHHNEDEPLLVKSQPALCAPCHGAQVADFRNKPFTHRIGRAGLVCSTCHEPHGRPGHENLRTTFAGEAGCLACHSDKRGPFVFSHGGVATGDCVTCHEPHGSANPKQLRRANVYQLCLECHSPIATGVASLGSQPPSFHNITNPRYQNCTTCHVAVHGSNRSPELLK